MRGSEAAQSAGFVVIFPLAVAKVSPVTVTTDTARTYALEGGVPGSLPEAAAWIVGLSRSSSRCAYGATGG